MRVAREIEGNICQLLCKLLATIRRIAGGLGTLEAASREGVREPLEGNGTDVHELRRLSGS